MVAGQRSRRRLDTAASVPLARKSATLLARARADVDDVVGRADRLLIVLHDEHRVAEVAQSEQSIDQAPIVALVQPDGRLVENVEDAGERASNLGCQTNPLRLATGESVRGAVQSEIARPTRSRKRRRSIASRTIGRAIR